MVIRNSKGEVMAALSEKIMKPPAMETVELLAARCAVAFSLEVGFRNSVFEDSSASIIKTLQDRNMPNSQGGHIIKDI